MTPHNTYRKTPDEMAYALEHEAYVDDEGAYRWYSSANVVPKDYVEIAGVSGEALERHKLAYDADTERILAEYRQARARHGYSAEERAEIAAAFGPGTKVVDVITGEEVDLG